MRNNFQLFIIILLAISSQVSMKASVMAINTTVISTNDEFEILMEKIRRDFKNNPSSIEKSLNRYNIADGSFTDIDYSSIERTNWPPLVHLNRIYDFVFAYTNPQNRYYQNESLYKKIEKGLEYWHKRNPWCHNWWYNQIAEPQRLGILLIQMRVGKKKLPAQLENKILARIKKEGGTPVQWTGANRTDIALHWIYRSCLSKNETDLKIALENIYNPIVYTTKEGFQYDNSFFQHGSQLYIGGYGDEILKGVTQVAMYTRGTKYAIPEDKLALLSKFMRETYYLTIRGQYMLFDVLGRGVSRPGSTRKVHASLFARRMIELDPLHADEFRDIVMRLNGERTPDYALIAKHTHYFIGDYTLHVRPKYTFDVRMVSTRTARCEYGNGENLKTYFMSDGCTNIVVEGNEYADIFPIWNWTRIPGVTAPQVNEIPKAASDWQTPGNSTFAGGVSDSLYGASVYSYIDNHAGINTSAHKAWFFFDDEIVCLGTGIRSTSPYQICTTVNQCLLLDKEVEISNSNKVFKISESFRGNLSPDWILHNNIGYIFPSGGEVFVTKEMQTGNWYDINQSLSIEIPQKQKEVLTIGFNHGKSPIGATYAYIVVPAKKTVNEIKEYIQMKNIEILSNTENHQIVRHKGLGVWQMVFYNAGEFANDNITVKVNKGCALLLKKISMNKFSFHIADPGQTHSDIILDFSISDKSKKVKTIKCDFANDSIYAGASKTYDIQF